MEQFLQKLLANPGDFEALAVILVLIGAWLFRAFQASGVERRRADDAFIQQALEQYGRALSALRATPPDTGALYALLPYLPKDSYEDFLRKIDTEQFSELKEAVALHIRRLKDEQADKVTLGYTNMSMAHGAFKRSMIMENVIGPFLSLCLLASFGSIVFLHMQQIETLGTPARLVVQIGYFTNAACAVFCFLLFDQIRRGRYRVLRKGLTILFVIAAVLLVLLAGRIEWVLYAALSGGVLAATVLLAFTAIERRRR